MSSPSFREVGANSLSSAREFDIDRFNRDGYLAIPEFLPPDRVAILRQRVVQLLDEFSLEGHPMTKFSTGEKEAHVGDDVCIFC